MMDSLNRDPTDTAMVCFLSFSERHCFLASLKSFSYASIDPTLSETCRLAAETEVAEHRFDQLPSSFHPDNIDVPRRRQFEHR